MIAEEEGAPILARAPQSARTGRCCRFNCATMATPVILGRPGDVIAFGLDEYVTRIGGAPSYPASCGAPNEDLTTCRVCGSPMALLLQARVVLHMTTAAGASRPP